MQNRWMRLEHFYKYMGQSHYKSLIYFEKADTGCPFFSCKICEPYMNPFKGLCMAFFVVFRCFCWEKRHFEPEINGHEVSAKAVQFSPTIMIDEGKVLRS